MFLLWLGGTITQETLACILGLGLFIFMCLPIGSEPTPPSLNPGWYIDPENNTRYRWWDGDQWTMNTRLIYEEIEQ